MMDENIMMLVNGFLIIFLAPLFSGVLKKSKAFLRGYKGPSVFQVYYDIGKLFRKSFIKSKSSSAVTSFAPSAILAFTVVTTFFIPVVYAYPKVQGFSVFLVFFSFTAVKFMTALIGLDCASTFGGMGSSREMFISMMSEPLFLVLIMFLFMETGTFSVENMSYINSIVINDFIGHIIAASAFIIFLIVENTRVPVDNPETHLELTMVHEAMVLDISSCDLGFLELASSIKLAVFSTFFVNIFFPVGIAISLNPINIFAALFFYFTKMILFLFSLAVIEISTAKFRLFKVQDIIMAGFSLAVISLVISYL